MPKVSVVIPAYNATAYLPQTVDSILQQTFTDYEVLIVDDGSSDNPVELVAQIVDSRVHIISQRNQGAGAARNTGIKNARGSYVAFLDADDFWETTKLAKQVEWLDMNPEVGLVHTWVTLANPDGSLSDRTIRTDGEGYIWDQVVVYNPLKCGSTAMVRRRCFEELGYFDQSLKYSEDWDMWIRIARKYAFSVIAEPLTYYRIHPSNKSKNYEGQLQCFCQIIDKAFESPPEQYSHLKSRSYARAHLHAAWRAFSSDAYGRASDLLFQAIGYNQRLLVHGNCLHLLLKLVAIRQPLLKFPIELAISLRYRLLGGKSI
ncbi:glycosyl transferase family A [filamentous cyanobacterium CCP5]|nr:glycosyl transferase family A [filamentous cyanobacterium CCP5]